MAGMRPESGTGRSAVLRTALLLLLTERASHGYELADRLRELGMVTDMGALYRTLRSMDDHGDVRSWWDLSCRGPARRIYALTEEGVSRLRQALAGMEQQWATIDRLLNRARGPAPAAATTSL